MTGPDRGELALVLHTHMPYVEGYGTWPFGEEWLWEATATCYLPLLEAQYAGLPIVAPDAPIFHEVLGHSGIFIDPGHPTDAAARIAALVSHPGWRSFGVVLGERNLARWNVQAAADRDAVLRTIVRVARQPRRKPSHQAQLEHTGRGNAR